MAILRIISRTRSTKFACYALLMTGLGSVTGCATVSFDGPKTESTFIVDNAVSIVGGRNIGDEYFELKDGSVFVGFDVLAFGPVVSEISE